MACTQCELNDCDCDAPDDEDMPCGESMCHCSCLEGHVCGCDCPRCPWCQQIPKSCDCDEED